MGSRTAGRPCEANEERKPPAAKLAGGFLGRADLARFGTAFLGRKRALSIAKRCSCRDLQCVRDPGTTWA